MIELSRWFSYVEPEVRGVLPALMRQALRDACDRLATHSQIWDYEHPAITPVASQLNYTLTPPDGARVVGISHASQNGAEIFPRGKEWLDSHLRTWRTDTGNQAEYYFLPAPGLSSGIFRPIKTPNADAVAKTYIVDLYLAPAVDALEVPDWFFSEFREGIAAGAKARLFAMEDVPWGNARRGVAQAEAFEEAIGEARIRKAQSRTLGPLESKATPFGGVLEF